MSSKKQIHKSRNEKIVKLFLNSHSMLDISKQFDMDISEVEEVIFAYKPSQKNAIHEGIKMSKERNKTVNKKNVKHAFTGSKSDFKGDLFRQVKGSIEALKTMSKKDPLYQQTVIKASIELDIKNELFNEILNWINKLVSDKKKYTHYPYEDLLQSARTVAWTVINNYDFRKGKLTTYLTRFIQKSMDDEIRKMISEVSLPERAQTNIIKIRKFQNAFYLNNHRLPEYQEIADALNISHANVFDIRGYIIKDMSHKTRKNIKIEDFFNY